jgi:hypothetical protein
MAVHGEPIGTGSKYKTAFLSNSFHNGSSAAILIAIVAPQPFFAICNSRLLIP